MSMLVAIIIESTNSWGRDRKLEKFAARQKAAPLIDLGGLKLYMWQGGYYFNLTFQARPP